MLTSNAQAANTTEPILPHSFFSASATFPHTSSIASKRSEDLNTAHISAGDRSAISPISPIAWKQQSPSPGTFMSRSRSRGTLHLPVISGTKKTSTPSVLMTCDDEDTSRKLVRSAFGFPSLSMTSESRSFIISLWIPRLAKVVARLACPFCPSESLDSGFASNRDTGPCSGFANNAPFCIRSTPNDVLFMRLC